MGAEMTRTGDKNAMWFLIAPEEIVRKIILILGLVASSFGLVMTNASADQKPQRFAPGKPPLRHFKSYNHGIPLADWGQALKAIAGQQASRLNFTQVSACTGEAWSGSGCPSVNYYFSCDFAYSRPYDTDIAVAQQICLSYLGFKSYGVQRVQGYDGHRCGYIVDIVTCQ